MNLSYQDFAALCKFGASLVRNCPPTLDATGVLHALGFVESSHGKYSVPRFEPAYSRKGRYASRANDQRWGDAAACSYGPWQIMFINAQGQVPAITPAEMQTSPVSCAVATALFLDNVVLGRQGAQAIEQVLDAWNTGKFTDSILPAGDYVSRGAEDYRKWMQGS